VRIDLNVVNSTDSIELHGLDVVITKAVIKLADGSEIGMGSAPLISLGGATSASTKLHKCEGVVSKTEDTISMKFASAIPVGKASLLLDYDGELNNKMCGFYRAKATLDGKDEYMAVTQHEPTDCRRTMPCFDEPALKATFDVTLIVPSDYTALSNMPVKEEKAVDGGKKEVKFDTTPPMSTYLLAMVVARLDFVEGKSAKGVKYRVYTMPGVTKQGEFALGVGMKVLDFFSEYVLPHPPTCPYMLAAYARVACSPFLPQRCPACCHTDDAGVQLLRERVPAPEDGHGGDSRLLGGRYGELGAGDVPRDGAAHRRGELAASVEAARRLCRGARARAPVVRQPRDHDLVDRSLAQ